MALPEQGLGPVTSRDPFRPQLRCGSVSISQGSFLPLFHRPYLDPRVFSHFCPSNSCPHPAEGEGEQLWGPHLPARVDPPEGAAACRGAGGEHGQSVRPRCAGTLPPAPLVAWLRGPGVTCGSNEREERSQG